MKKLSSKSPSVESPTQRIIYVIGDLHGNIEAYYGNLRYLNLINERNEFIQNPTTVHLIFLGDILLDRKTDGITIYNEISKLKELGCRITMICGNHDAVFVEKLAGLDALSGLNPKQFKPHGFQRYYGPEYSLDTVPPTTLIANFKQTNEGHRFLELLQTLQIFHREHNALFVHVDPSTTRLQANIQNINSTFQSILSQAIDNPASIRAETQAALTRILEQFIPTQSNERKSIDNFKDITPEIAKQLVRSGITYIFYGHTYPNHDILHFTINTSYGPLYLIPVDRGYKKPLSYTTIDDELCIEEEYEEEEPPSTATLNPNNKTVRISNIGCITNPIQQLFAQI